MLFRRGVGARLRAVFFRSLATMFNSGVPLVGALELLVDQQEHPALSEACRGLARKLQEGHYLSKSMQRYPEIFRTLHVKIVMSGESSGRLGAVLLRLAEREECNDRLLHQVKSSLMMPLIVSFLCICLAVLAPPLLFQGMFQMLAEVGGSLPWTTRLMMGWSKFCLSPWFLGLLVLAALGASRLVRILREDVGLQRRLVGMPLLGESFRLFYLTDFLQNFRTMLDSGMPLLQALELSAQATDLRYLESVVQRVAGMVKEGEELSDALAASQFFPPALIQGVRASEEAGGLPVMLARLESLFRLNLEQRLEVVMRSLEPMVLSVIGLLVGFTLIATLQPLLSVLDKL